MGEPGTKMGSESTAPGWCEDLVRLRESLIQDEDRELLVKALRGIAHDFNNVLFLIVNHSHFVQDTLPENHRARREVTAILDACSTAQSLTRQLADSSESRVHRST